MRAKPLIIWGLLAGVFVLPATVLALGLGKLTVDSSLGQPLSAHVELTAAQKEELDSLAAKVADQSVYRDNNVQYPAALSRARVTIEQSANGPPQLKVTTQQAINDPYLDLIVEVNWATGRVVRNYTFLLDPPGASEKQAVAPTAAAIRAEAAPSRGARAERSAPSAAGPSSGQGDTYTVRRGDTLSKIAKVYKPENVSLEQMLVALLRNNESAFDGKNMNRLRSGQILTVPPADQAAGVTQNEAVKVVRVQAADWRTYRDRVAAAAPATEAGQAGQAAGGKITTAVEDKAAPAQPGKDQLRVSREAGKGAGAGATQVEDLAAKDKALRDANSRIADLEKTLKDMQRAVELKSQTMAELQKQAEADKAKAAEAAKSAPKIATAPSVAPPVVPPVTSAPSTTSPAPAAVVPPPAPVTPPAAAAPESKAAGPAAPETKAPETKAQEATPAKAPETKAPATKAAAPTPKASKAEPSFFDDLFGNTPTWAIGAAVLGILALIAGLVAARRRTATKFEDSIISGTDIKTNTVFGSTGGGVVNTGDNSLASDFSREGLGNIDTDEVDPIAEAEVYLAYGRDAQAEEILKEALKKDAQRQEIYLKLLEIHAQHNKPSAFETVASELYSVSGGQGEVWQKAVALGRQLDPSNPMFTEAGSAADFAAAATGADTERGADEPAAEPGPAPASAQVYSMPPDLKPEPKPGRDLEFSLDDDISLSPTSGMAPEPKTPAAILAGAAQEVAKSTRGAADTVVAKGTSAPMAGATALAKDGEALSAQTRDTVSFEPESIPKFDLDFNLDEASRPGPTMSPIPTHAAPQPVAPKPAPEPALAAVAAGAPAPQLTRPAAAIELDKLDLAFDPQRSTFEDPTPSVLDGQWHDAATKLDLAKAYQEMGDVEGAREILQEVLHEGDDQQKSEAQGLLSKLA
jgi:pilus assembly protein FimV